MPGVLAAFFATAAGRSDAKFLAESRGWRTELIQAAIAQELEGSLPGRIELSFELWTGALLRTVNP